MDSLPPPLARIEEERIRAAYARRREGDLYSWFNLGHLFMMQERERRTLALLKRYGFVALETKRILEVGCGTGFWLREFIKWGGAPENLAGVDLLPDRIAAAKKLCPQWVNLQCNNAVRLAFPDATFDLVLQSTAFTSVLDPSVRQLMASEMLRVVRQDGLILWYDYYINNPWNSDVQGVKKREIYRLFPECRIALRRITLLPPLLRTLAPYSWLLCYLFERIPWLCTHYLGVIQRGASP